MNLQRERERGGGGGGESEENEKEGRKRSHRRWGGGAADFPAITTKKQREGRRGEEGARVGSEGVGGCSEVKSKLSTLSPGSIFRT